MFVKRITSQSLVIGAPAKVNLFLEILNKRPDGYHNLNSLFQAVSLFDRLTFSVHDDPAIQIHADGQPIDTGEDNLIAKAWRLLQREYGITAGVQVRLEKNIPIGGGLGGGSTDAAATLLAGNILLELNLTKDRLRELGLQLGSDIPFFFTGGQAVATGRGEMLAETEYPTDYWILLVTPRLSISTADSYAGLNLTLTDSKNPFKLGVCRTAQELIERLRLSGNDFEGQHRIAFPVLERIAQALMRQGASLVRMSGSGATMFGLFEAAPESDDVLRDSEPDWQVHLVRPVLLPRL